MLRLDNEGPECTLVGMKRLSMLCWMLALAVSLAQAQPALPGTASAPGFKVLALAETGGHHGVFPGLHVIDHAFQLRVAIRKCTESTSPLAFRTRRWKFYS